MAMDHLRQLTCCVPTCGLGPHPDNGGAVVILIDPIGPNLWARVICLAHYREHVQRLAMSMDPEKVVDTPRVLN
jgi:hypothetical protein